MKKFFLVCVFAFFSSLSFADDSDLKDSSRYYDIMLPIDWTATYEESGFTNVEKSTFVNEKLGLAVVIEISTKSGSTLDSIAKSTLQNLKQNKAKVLNFVRDNGFIQIDFDSGLKQRMYLSTNGNLLSRILVVGQNLDNALFLMRQIQAKKITDKALFPDL